MKENKKILKRKERGITLIALVITIIVLLILAGVSIAMLTGENGILTQAQKAKNETENAQVLEEERLNEYNNTINNWVNGGTATTPTFDEDTLTIGDATNADKYGWRVPGYTVKAEEMTTNVWRLFYQDSNYTYLITDECVGSYMLSDYYAGVYNSGADVSTIGQKLNPMLLEAGTFFTSSNTNANILATAWLTDPDKWAEFKNVDAVFAIGSPTVELFVKSFNATASTNGANTITLGVGTYGYTEDTTSNQLKTTYNNGIYNKSTSSNWWLSSPYGATSGVEFNVYASNGFFNGNVVNVSSYAVRPLVCIPTSVFNNEYLSSLDNS